MLDETNSYLVAGAEYTEGAQPAFQTTEVNLVVRREAAGIVYRLAFPIMLLILLVGLSFWGEVSSRVDITITILLAVSALYIVIFSSIPMLGYLTVFDYYILSVSVAVWTLCTERVER